ncbi:helix-turn-helix domain-containing protein [Streptomyces sp. NPDC005859]|uniref:helix-turn-helix domain-containing protein n=1 Tax=Streptomyces sp. NPDC005859 TaxID=3157170 RepID=UPI00340B660A
MAHSAHCRSLPRWRAPPATGAEKAGLKEAVSKDLFRVADGKLAEHWDALTPQITKTVSGRIAVLRHLLSVLVLRLADQPGGLPSTTEDSDTFRRFREAVERGFTKTREVADYARDLGYSPRTLTRATASAVGTSAKGFIDERVMLEAKRRLAHSDEPAVRVAAHLGFSSATNFSKYFQSRAGQSPIQFRNAARQVPRPQGEP